MHSNKLSVYKGLTEKRLAIFMMILLLLSLIPLLALSFFSYPAMDDFMFGAPVAAAAKNGFFAALRTALSSAVDYYYSWQGTFTAIPLFCLQPGVWGTAFYGLTTWIMLAALCVGTFRICSVLLRDYAHAGDSAFYITAACILIVVIQFFPSVYEALYWFNGSIYYIWFQALMMFWLSEALLFLKDGKMLRLIPATVYAFLISGGNYVTVLLTMELNVILLCAAFLKRNRKAKFLLFPFAILCAGFAVSAAAPGNAARAEVAFSLSHAIRSILTSVGAAGESIGEYVSLYLLLICVILIPVFIHAIRNTQFEFPKPVAVTALTFLLYASSFTPTAFALGTAEGPHRLRNMRYWLFVMLFVFNLFYMIGWLFRSAKTEGKFETIYAFVKKLSVKHSMVVAAAVFAMFSVCLCLSPARSQTATLGAMRSLLSGEASAWRRENINREAILMSDKSDVVLPAHKVRPVLLTSYDEDGNMNDTWSVNKMKVYYNKNSVVIE